MQSNLHFSWQNSLSLAISQMHLLVQLSGKTWLQACSILALLGSVSECLMLIYILTMCEETAAAGAFVCAVFADKGEGKYDQS
jgi:hypothetical protein